jgi:hypothetical protein
MYKKKKEIKKQFFNTLFELIDFIELSIKDHKNYNNFIISSKKKIIFYRKLNSNKIILNYNSFLKDYKDALFSENENEFLTIEIKEYKLELENLKNIYNLQKKNNNTSKMWKYLQIMYLLSEKYI